jgi:hypothetical protein
MKQNKKSSLLIQQRMIDVVLQETCEFSLKQQK